MLEICNLTKTYGGVGGLDGLSLRLKEGEVLCVLGPSGCGKSTLLKLVSGLEEPDAGTIRIGDRLIVGPGVSLPPERRPVNMVFQDYALWPHMRVRHIIGYGLNRLPSRDRQRRVDELLAMLQLESYADRLPRELSGGQQQRVAIARALATEPEVLLFDEPLSNLDVQLRLEMRHELAELFGRLGRTVLYVTHDPLEACAFADRLLVLRRGRLEQLGDTRSLFAEPASPWVAALAGYDGRFDAEALEASSPGECVARVGEQSLRVRLHNGTVGAVPGPLAVMLHSGTVHIGAAGGAPLSGDCNQLEGRVEQCLYEGRAWRVRLTLGGQRLSLLSPRPVPLQKLLQVSFPVAETLGFPAEPSGC